MIYRFHTSPAALEQLASDVATLLEEPTELTAAFLPSADLATLLAHAELPIDPYLQPSAGNRCRLDILEECGIGVMSLMDVSSAYGHASRLVFYFKKNLLAVCALGDEADVVEKLFTESLKRFKPAKMTLEKLLYALLAGVLARDAQGLEPYAHRAEELEAAVALGRADQKASVRIYEQKKRLLILRRFYSQLIDMSETLESNQNDVFEAETLHYFGLLTSRAERLEGECQLLLDELSQLRDALTAAQDHQLNRVMEALTILSAVFLPPTLMVGWYGMNFANMPELQSPYAYPIFIGVCVAMVVATLWWCRRKKWF